MQSFDALTPPFDRLTRAEADLLRKSVDVEYYAPGRVIVAKGQASDHLHVIIKGTVAERGEGVIEALLGAKDTFDAAAVVHGSASAHFEAAEETLCYILPKAVILDLVHQNQAFAAFFYAELSRRLDAFAVTHTPQGLESVLRQRVADVRWTKAVFIDADTTIEVAGHVMRDNTCNAVFVTDAARTGIITGMDLSKAVILERMPLDTPVRNICAFEVASVEREDFIFDALIAMTRCKKRRIAIRDGETYAGLLEDINILELFAGNSQLIPGRIDRATTVEELAPCASDIQSQVERLHAQGIKVDVIAEITSDLNRNLLSKLFDLTAPPSIRERGCLIVMGSEGRGEQTVRTDQDNGLLLEAPVPAGDLDGFRASFTQALEQFGFPPCPGNVMVRNPLWSQPIDSFVKQLKAWILVPSGDSAMSLGIFADATAIAGHAALLTQAKTAFMELMRGESAYLSQFAHLIDLFASADIGPLATLMASVGGRSPAIDIKKMGTFPIVHGTRTLAIEKGIMETSTAGRIEALVAEHVLDQRFARDLTSALRFFMELRLRSQLRAMRLNTPETESHVHVNDLSPTERDLLRNAVRVVKQFREIVRHRFNLGYF